MPSTYDQSNPFFQQMPFVAIVRTVVNKGGESVMVSELECQRVHFRIGNNRVFPVKTSQDEIFPTGKQGDKMMGFDKLIPLLPPTAEPTTANFTSAQIVNGFTGPISTTKEAGKIYGRARRTLWSGWITGTDAKITLSTQWGDSDTTMECAVNGGEFTIAPRTGQVFTLYTGQSEAIRFVEIRYAESSGDAVYMNATGNVLEVKGIAPLVQVLSNKVQVGGNSSTGLYSGAWVDNDDSTYSPKLQAPSGQDFGTNVGCIKLRGAFNTLVATITSTRRVAVSKNGAAPTFYTGSSETDGAGIPVRAIVIPCDGSLATYYVWDNGANRNGGGVFAVAGDAPLQDIGIMRRLDQYGDSISAGSGATPQDTETMAVAAALGFVGSVNGVAGLTIEDAATMMDNVLPNRTVNSNDVAIIAVGGNNAFDGIDSDEKAAYLVLINKLLAKGYGKVLCRGILPPESDPDLANPANAEIKSVVDALANPNVIWIDPRPWVGYGTSDGVHPTAAGYRVIAGFAAPAYAAALGL